MQHMFGLTSQISSWCVILENDPLDVRTLTTFRGKLGECFINRVESNPSNCRFKVNKPEFVQYTYTILLTQSG